MDKLEDNHRIAGTTLSVDKCYEKNCDDKITYVELQADYLQQWHTDIEGFGRARVQLVGACDTHKKFLQAKYIPQVMGTFVGSREIAYSVDEVVKK